MFLDKGNGLVPHAVLDMFFRSAFLEIRELPRGHETARRPRAGPMRHIHVEAMVKRIEGVRAQVPFAEVARCVAGVLQRLGKSVVLRIKTRGALADDRLVGTGAPMPQPSVSSGSA